MTEGISGSSANAIYKNNHNTSYINLNIDKKDHAVVPFKLQPSTVCSQPALRKMSSELPGLMGQYVHTLNAPSIL